MSRFINIAAVLWWSLWAGAVGAQQTFSGLAQVNTALSQITDTRGGLRVVLGLSQGVPYRVYTLADPARLVLDFREVDWRGVDKTVLLNADNALDVRMGAFRPGWSRMVVDLDGPLVLQSSNVVMNKSGGQAVVIVNLKHSDATTFARQSGAPDDPEWDMPAEAVLPAAPKMRPGDGLLRVVLDPGHGGIDPGADREGVVEKDLMLTLARELKEELLRSGRFEVVLTRDDDSFVSLERRVEIAHAVDAQVLISLHADTAAEGDATGAVVHLLSKTASDEASRKLAERHDRADMLAGVDLTGKDDEVAEVLLDLARMETEPRTLALARALVGALNTAGAPMNRKPIRAAGFSVLKAADIPSLLLEIGFLSSGRDLENLRNPDWRAQISAGIREALQVWVIEDAAASRLVRQ